MKNDTQNDMVELSRRVANLAEEGTKLSERVAILSEQRKSDIRLFLTLGGVVALALGYTNFTAIPNELDKRITPQVTTEITAIVEEARHNGAEIKRISDNARTLDVPLGTIISSTLDYKDLADILGETLPFDPKKSRWAPADGREIVGSRLGNRRNKTPDLRGQFLRGRNSFYPTDEPSEFSNGRDDGERHDIGHYSYQSQSIGNHIHTFSATPFYVSTYSTNSVTGAILKNATAIETSTPLQSKVDETNEELSDIRPKNVAIYYYVKINP